MQLLAIPRYFNMLFSQFNPNNSLVNNVKRDDFGFFSMFVIFKTHICMICKEKIKDHSVIEIGIPKPDKPSHPPSPLSGCIVHKP